jgi:hypothetical protein
VDEEKVDFAAVLCRQLLGSGDAGKGVEGNLQRS